MIKVDLPKDQDLYTLVKGIEDFEEFCQDDVPKIEVEKDPQLEEVFKLFTTSSGELIDSAASGFISICDKHAKKKALEQPEEKVDEPSGHAHSGSVNIFIKPNATGIQPEWLAGSIAEIDYPMIDRTHFDQAIIYVLRCFGLSQKSAQQQSGDVLQSLTISTTYLHPKEDEVLSASDFKNVLTKVVDSIGKSEVKEV